MQGSAGNQSDVAIPVQSQIFTVAQEAKVNNTDPTISEARQVSLMQKVEALNVAMELHAISVKFVINKNLGHTTVKMVDKDSGNVLQQFSSKELRTISLPIYRFNGMLVKTQA